MNSLSFWRRHELRLFVAVLCVAILTCILDAQHNYYVNPRDSALDLLRQWSLLGLFALGSAVVIITGGIDLSSGSVIAFSGTICATLLLLLVPETMIRSEPLPLWAMALAIGGALLSGFLIGSLHAWLITVVGLPPFVATLATLVGLRSLARAICESVTLSVLGGASNQINVAATNFRYLSQSVWIPAVLLVVLSAILWVLLSKTVLGRHLYALGGNEVAARLSGVQTDRLKWVAYCISAMLSSLAGVIYICEQTVADPQTLGRGYELNAIAAAVVGGCSLQGGIGTVPGTLLGVLFLRTVIDGVAKIIKAGADVYEGLIVGVVVVFAVVFTKGQEATQRAKSLFAGTLGAVTIANLTLIAGVLMALIGSRLLDDVLVMDASWLAVISMIAVAALLLILRFSPTNARRWGIVWSVVTILVVIGSDQAYPSVQANRAISTVVSLGGRVSRNDDGIIVTLEQTPLDDTAFRRLKPRLTHLTPLVELRLQGTRLTDRSIDAISLLSTLKSVDLRETALTAGGVRRLQRQLPNAKIVTSTP